MKICIRLADLRGSDCLPQLIGVCRWGYTRCMHACMHYAYILSHVDAARAAGFFLLLILVIYVFAGYKFVCLTSPEVPTLRESLHHIYASLFVEYVVKAPGHHPSLPVTQTAFAENLLAFLKSLPYYASN